MKRIFRWIPSIILLSIFIATSVSGHSSPHNPSPVILMPLAGIGAYVCQRLQDDIKNYFQNNIAQLRTLGSTAFIKWLLSNPNRSGFKQISSELDPIPGKKRGVAFQVSDPFCFDLCAVSTTCTTEYQTSSPGIREITFDLTNPPFRHCDGDGLPVKLRFSEDELMAYCKNDDTTFMREQIVQYLFQFERALDKALVTILNTQVGTNAAAEAITNVPIFTSGNTFTPNLSVLNPEALWYLNQIFQDIGNEGQYAMIGGTIVNKIIQFKNWSGLNAAGVDITKNGSDNPYPYYDRNFNTTFGQSDFLMISPGATQLVTWNKYKGEKRRSVTNLYTKGTVFLPTSGLEVDFKWIYDPSCEIWTFEAFLHAELVTVPAGGCGDNMAGVNGIIRIHDCGTQPIVPACPESGSSA